jgi:hypothetical protein
MRVGVWCFNFVEGKKFYSSSYSRQETNAKSYYITVLLSCAFEILPHFTFTF